MSEKKLFTTSSHSQPLVHAMRSLTVCRKVGEKEGGDGEGEEEDEDRDMEEALLVGRVLVFLLSNAANVFVAVDVAVTVAIFVRLVV